MNNFVFGSGDPLLYGSNMVRPEYNEPDIKKQLDNVMMQYQQMQQAKQDAPAQKDWIGEFDSTLKGLDEDIASMLSTDQEFVQLNAELQQSIQDEIMLNIKWKLNNKQDVIYKVKRLNEIIDTYNRNKANRDKQQMAEITEYLQNYSDMTFNEYKKMKESK